MEASASSLASSALALDEIQGNVAGFSKPLQTFVFLGFPDMPSARGFLHVVIREIDTADDVLDYNRRYKSDRKRDRCPPPERWFNLGLTFAALQLLEASELETFEEAFQQGMRARAAHLGDVDDSAPQTWVSPFKDQIHAVAILAADSPDDLGRLDRQLGHHCHAHGVQDLGREEGSVRPGEARGHEHFGFKDGISQPGIQGMTTEPKVGQEMIPAGEFIFGYPTQEDKEPLPPAPGAYDPVPAPAPKSFPSWAVNGSLLVFRRLRQNVKGFNDFVAQATASTTLRPDLVEAKLVGRYKSGAPLELTRDQEPTVDPQVADPSVADPSILEEERINNFDYEPQDADGHLVPRAAHIRKAYPRSETPPGMAESERHRILRRGITYGTEFQPMENPYPDSGNPPDEQDRGLLFACYQASIERGFEFIQTQWANQEDFPQAGDGRDPITAQDVAAPTFSMPPDRHLILQRWVITTGGEYFFSPSISALRQLAGDSES